MSTAVGKDGSFRVEAVMDHPRSTMLPFGEVVHYSAPSPDRPEANQDAAVVISLRGTGVLAVSDGAGGTAGGATASSITVECLEQVLARLDPEQTVRSAVLDAIEAANQQIRARVPGALATVALFIVEGQTARAISVGDSICLLVGGRGRLKYRSIAHGPTGFAEEAGLLDEREALVHEERHLVSNMLGLDVMRVEVGVPLALAPRDTLLVACDALFDNARLDEIARLLSRGPLLDGVRALAELVRGRMNGGKPPSHPDDLTILACRRRRASAGGDGAP